MRYTDQDKTIIKLNEDTRIKKTVWKMTKTIPSTVGGEEKLLDYAYTTQVADRILRLYKYRYKSYVDEEQYMFTEGHRLEFIDDEGKGLWEFPQTDYLRDLYETVRLKTANIESFFSKYLNE